MDYLYLKFYFKIISSGKNMVAFCSTVQKFHWLFLLGVSVLWVDFKKRQKKNYIQLIKKCEQLLLTLDNSKSKQGQGDY